MLKFLSASVFPGPRNQRFGQPQALFDTLQVVCSHLLLSPTSKMTRLTGSTRDTYDLARAYLWKEPLVTLYRRVEEEAKPDPPKKKPKRKTILKGGRPMFPNLKRPTLKSKPEPPKFRYELDMHSLLHIRNFWHRHLITEGQSGFSNERANWTTEKTTYADMAKALSQAGFAPEKWDKQLSDDSSLNGFATQWYGHYSCMHPWPKSRWDLDDRQTSAEDWKSVDPLVSLRETIPTVYPSDKGSS